MCGKMCFGDGCGLDLVLVFLVVIMVCFSLFLELIFGPFKRWLNQTDLNVIKYS